jgi:putative transcriptional regulator
MGNQIFQDIKTGLEQAIAFAEGSARAADYRVHVPSEIDVRGIRRRLRLTQDQFAYRFGFNVARLRDWEQGRSKPDGALRAYLLVIQREPEAVERALEAAR